MDGYHGAHDYPGITDEKFERTIDCAFGCGCWMGSTRSGSPEGVDPFGECPKHLVSAEEYVEILRQRIKDQKKAMLAISEGRTKWYESWKRVRDQFLQQDELIKALRLKLSYAMVPKSPVEQEGVTDDNKPK